MDQEDIRGVPTRLPSPHDMALALAVVNTKPPELTVREYIASLIYHVSCGRRRPKHLDRSSYWRSEHERVDEALSRVVSENTKLKCEIESLKTKLSNAVYPETTQVQKRKVIDRRTEEGICRLQSPNKKAKFANVSLEALYPLSCLDEALNGFPITGAFGQTGTALITSLYQLHLQFDNDKSFEADAWAYHLGRLASNLPKLFQISLKTCDQDSSNSLTFEDVLPLASKVNTWLVRGFAKLASAPAGSQLTGQVTYAYAQMFHALLQTLQDTVALEKNQIAQMGHIDGKAKQKASKPKGKTSQGKQNRASYAKGAPSVNAIISYMSSIIGLLDPDEGTQRDLFEAFAFCLMERLGNRLFLLTFGHRRGATIEDEVINSHTDERRVFGKHGPKSEDSRLANVNEEDVGQARFEAPYLVLLLKRFISIAPLHLGISSKSGKVAAKKATTSKTATAGSMICHLAEAAREKLQRTLVNCTFGTEGMHKDDVLMNCLRPAMQPAAVALPKVKEVDVDEWFKGEVWNLVGWEILSKEGGL